MALTIGIDQEPFTFRMIGAVRREDRIPFTAGWVLTLFEQFYTAFLEVSYRAKTALEHQHHSTSIWLSHHRLSLYRRCQSLSQGLPARLRHARRHG